MSDVIVSTTESTTNVTTTNDVTTIAITDTVVEVSQATAGLQGPPGANSDPIYVFVTNKTGAQLNKGAIVYVSGANGTHTQVSLAIATGDVTSARTLGWLSEDIANNATGLCMVEGYLDGVNTQGVTEGAQLYLSPTVAGGFTENKPSAPDHMVYVGVCAKASAGNGRVFVKVQNGYELEELHNVKITSPANNDLLRYVSGTALWENVAATAITVGSAIVAGTAVFASSASTASNAGTASYALNADYATTSGTAVSISGTITRSQVSDYASGTVANITGSITRSQVSNFASGTVAVATVSAYADESGTALFATNANYATTSGTSVSISGSITRSQVSDYASGTVASAGTAQQAGTAVFASTASTATYATTSGTSVSISGTITTSQVSDFASGTVANISGTVTQSQVTNLTTDLAGKANLTGGNSFTGAQVIATNGTANVGLIVRGTAGQSANLFEAQNSGSTVIARVDKNGAVSANYFGPSGSGLLGYLDWTTSSPLFQTGGTAVVGIRVRGAASQSANLQEWQDSSGGTAALITSAGRGAFPRISAGAATDLGYGTLSLLANSTATVAIVARGLAGQSADLQQWQNSSGGTVSAIDSTGQVMAYNGIRSNSIVNTTTFNNSRIQISNTGTIIDTGIFTNAALRVQNTNSTATANLTEWLTSTGSTAAYVGSGGAFRAAVLQTSSAAVDARLRNAGGEITFAKATAVSTNPGAGYGKIYFRDGTNAGTLKLVVIAGATGAETTILDNIPT